MDKLFKNEQEAIAFVDDNITVGLFKNISARIEAIQHLGQELYKLQQSKINATNKDL